VAVVGGSSPRLVVSLYQSEQKDQSFVAASQVLLINTDVRTASLEWTHHDSSPSYPYSGYFDRSGVYFKLSLRNWESSFLLFLSPRLSRRSGLAWWRFCNPDSGDRQYRTGDEEPTGRPASEGLPSAECGRSRTAGHGMDVEDSVCREDAFSRSSRLFIGTYPDASVSLAVSAVPRSGKRKVIGTPNLAKASGAVKWSGRRPLAAADDRQLCGLMPVHFQSAGAWRP